jgi:hypothetical protein
MGKREREESERERRAGAEADLDLPATASPYGLRLYWVIMRWPPLSAHRTERKSKSV